MAGNIVSGGADLTKLGKGAIRAIIALDPETTPAPESLQDVLGLISPYTLAAGWTDMGATANGNPGYSRGIESEELEINEITGAIDTDITDVPRSVTLPLAHISDETMTLLENGGTAETVAADDNTSAQSRVPFGLFTSLPPVRVVLLGQRSLKAGLVVEPSTATRARIAALVLNYVELSADEASFEFGKGSLWSGEVGFRALPDPDADEGEEHGSWIFEDAGTITAP